MYMSVAMVGFRYAGAFTVGLLFNAALFTALWTVSSGTFEAKPVVATRVEFTRMRRDTDTMSRREDMKAKTEVADIPPMPRLEMAMPNTDLSRPEMLQPTFDVASAFKDAGGSAGYESDVIPMVRIPPVYPRTAKLAKIQGYVTMEVVINPEGTVTEVSVVEAAPPRMFDIAAMDAMKRWRFRPKVVNGVPVSQRAQQTIEFRIEG